MKTKTTYRIERHGGDDIHTGKWSEILTTDFNWVNARDYDRELAHFDNREIAMREFSTAELENAKLIRIVEEVATIDGDRDEIGYTETVIKERN